MMYNVYGIVSPITRMVIYVGLTSQPVHKRIANHACDKASAAYSAIQWIRAQGLREDWVILDYSEDYKEALLFEAEMIMKIKGLCNREHKKIRDRKLVSYMLEDYEVEGILNGRDTTIMRRYTDHDDVPEHLVGRPRRPDDVTGTDN